MDFLGCRLDQEEIGTSEGSSGLLTGLPGPGVWTLASGGDGGTEVGWQRRGRRRLSQGNLTRQWANTAGPTLLRHGAGNDPALRKSFAIEVPIPQCELNVCNCDACCHGSFGKPKVSVLRDNYVEPACS